MDAQLKERDVENVAADAHYYLENTTVDRIAWRGIRVEISHKWSKDARYRILEDIDGVAGAGKSLAVECALDC